MIEIQRVAHAYVGPHSGTAPFPVLTDVTRAVRDAEGSEPRLASAWREHRVGLTRFTAVGLALFLWDAVARHGAVSPLFLVGPAEVAARLFSLFASGTIWPHLVLSAQEIGIGFGLAALVGIPLGIAMGRVALIRDVLEPFIVAKYSSPTVAFLPLLILWLGIGLWSKVVLIFLAAVFVLVINVEVGVSTVSRQHLEVARSFSASEWRVIRTIVIPSAAPYILAGLRLAVGRVLIMMVVAEMFASTAGLGHLIFDGAAKYDTSLVFAGVVLIAGAGILLNQSLRYLERRAAPWREGAGNL